MLDCLACPAGAERGSWRDGPIALGQLGPAAADRLGDTAPLWDADHRLCLVADARIDNRAELHRRLKSRGCWPRSDSAVELILQCYLSWGEDCVTALEGDFVFAIWDGRRGRMLAACAPLGLKPLYYLLTQALFRFASEPRALFADGRLPRRPNLPLLGRYLLRRFDEPEQTLDADVHRLAGGQLLLVSAQQARRQRYWDIDPGRQVRLRHDDEYAEQFLHLFRGSIAARLPSAAPAGVLLSGGVDSSAIASTARLLIEADPTPGRELRAFSLILDHPTCDERRYIREVVGRGHIPLYWQRLKPDSDWLDLERVRQFPDVYYLPTLWMLGPLFESARQAGTTVLLSGIGGDDLMAACLDHLTDLTRQGRWLQLIWQLGHDARGTGYPWLQLARDYCLMPILPEPIKRLARPVYDRLRAGSAARLPTWLNLEVLRQNGVLDRLASPLPAPRFPTRAQQRIYDMLQGGWNTTIALVAADRFARRLGVELRHPFLDRRVVEFLLAVPEEQRWHGRWTKTVLRRAMRGILPELVRKRAGKAEFSVIIEKAWRGRQRAQLERLLSDPLLARLDLIQADRFRAFFYQTMRSSVPLSDRAWCEIVIWLELWLRGAWNGNEVMTDAIHGKATFAQSPSRAQP